jgi:hypothetical protein
LPEERLLLLPEEISLLPEEILALQGPVNEWLPESITALKKRSKWKIEVFLYVTHTGIRQHRNLSFAR